MTEHDYDNGYRAGMQKMRDIAQPRIDEQVLWVQDLATELNNAEARIDKLEEALGDMVDLFSADDMLLKGTHLHATLKQARATLKGTNK
tara:strand:+ start:2696 stop:2962 length:267 start_codon:yes stop_codon:yes gene_type:complete